MPPALRTYSYKDRNQHKHKHKRKHSVHTPHSPHNHQALAQQIDNQHLVTTYTPCIFAQAGSWLALHHHQSKPRKRTPQLSRIKTPQRRYLSCLVCFCYSFVAASVSSTTLTPFPISSSGSHRHQPQRQQQQQLTPNPPHPHPTHSQSCSHQTALCTSNHYTSALSTS